MTPPAEAATINASWASMKQLISEAPVGGKLDGDAVEILRFEMVSLSIVNP